MPFFSHLVKSVLKTCVILGKKPQEGSMTLGEKIKQLRREKGLSQAVLEQRSGVNSKLLSKYENGRIIPTADTLRKIAEGLEISADYLLFDNVPKNGLSPLKDLELFEMFKEVEGMDQENKGMIKNLINAVIVRNKVQGVLKPAYEEPWEDRMRKTLSKFRKRAKGYSEEEILQIVEDAVKAVRVEEEKRTN
jgi:transcriptional regulator with XRE-family HTH domain